MSDKIEENSQWRISPMTPLEIGSMQRGFSSPQTGVALAD
jgi:hypothetical protein